MISGVLGQMVSGVASGSIVGQGGAAAAVAMQIIDNFTDTNGVILPNHTPDTNTTGNPWLNDHGVLDIQSNAAKISSVGTSPSTANSVIDCGESDVVLSSDATNLPNGVSSSVFARYVDENNAWVGYIARVNSTQIAVRIYEANAGVFTIRATSGNVSDLPGIINMTANGTNITVNNDGVNEITYGSATFQQTETKIGIGGSTSVYEVSTRFTADAL